MRAMMAQAAAEVEDEPTISFISRRLDMDEAIALHSWMTTLPVLVWSPEDSDRALQDLLMWRSIEVILPAYMTKELIYAKLTWG